VRRCGAASSGTLTLKRHALRTYLLLLNILNKAMSGRTKE
jgi:hypothetical protein